MNAELGLVAHGVLHLVERGGYAFFLEMTMYELQQLVLFTSQHESSPLPARSGTKRKPCLFYYCSEERSRLAKAGRIFSECPFARPWDRRWPSRWRPASPLAWVTATRRARGCCAYRPWRSCSR